MKLKTLLPSFAAGLISVAALRAADPNPPAPPPPPAAEKPEPTSSSSSPRPAAGRDRAQRPGAALGEIKKLVDANGKITKEEFLTQSKTEAEERFSRMDGNGDGSIDKAEFDALTSRMRAARENSQDRRKGGRPERKRPGADGKSASPGTRTDTSSTSPGSTTGTGTQTGK